MDDDNTTDDPARMTPAATTEEFYANIAYNISKRQNASPETTQSRKNPDTPKPRIR